MNGLEVLRSVGTAVIADVLDAEGIDPTVLSETLTPLRAAEPFAGPAYTISGRMETFHGPDRDKLAAIDAMPTGGVAVWAGHDIRGACCFGDLLASSMVARGCVGIVVDGGVRDAAFLASLPVPILSRYVTPAQAIGRWKVTGRDEPVEVRGALEDWVTVRPGDIVVADGDGCLVVSPAVVDRILARVSEWASSESAARDAISAGLPLLAALERYGHL